MTRTYKLPGYRGLLKELHGRVLFALLAENGEHPVLAATPYEVVRDRAAKAKRRP